MGKPGTYYNPKQQVTALEALITSLPDTSEPFARRYLATLTRTARPLAAEKADELVDAYVTGEKFHDLSQRFGVSRRVTARHAPNGDLAGALGAELPTTTTWCKGSTRISGRVCSSMPESQTQDDQFARQIKHFFNSTNKRDRLVGPRVDPARYLGVVSRVLDRPVEEHIVSGRLAFGSKNSLYYPASEAEVVENASRRTTILQNLQLSGGSIQILTEALERGFSRTVTASCYASLAGMSAFDWHVDKWDSVIIQLEGMKQFHFSDGTSHTLEAGDVMMFRRDVEHRTETPSRSVHLSIAIH